MTILGSKQHVTHPSWPWPFVMGKYVLVASRGFAEACHWATCVYCLPLDTEECTLPCGQCLYGIPWKFASCHGQPRRKQGVRTDCGLSPLPSICRFRSSITDSTLHVGGDKVCLRSCCACRRSCDSSGIRASSHFQASYHKQGWKGRGGDEAALREACQEGKTGGF